MEDNVATTTLGTDANAPLPYAAELEHHQPIISKLGDRKEIFERERTFLFSMEYVLSYIFYYIYTFVSDRHQT